jgi:hypothetical protein
VRLGLSLREKLSVYEYRDVRRIFGLKRGALHEIGVNCVMRKQHEDEVRCITREERA